MVGIDNSYSHLLDGRASASVNFARANRAVSDISTSLFWNATATTDEENRAAAAREVRARRL